LDEAAFDELVSEIASQGYSEETAIKYAVLIGDRPIRDEENNLIVQHGFTIARLKPLNIFTL